MFTVLRSARRPVRLLRVPEETHELTRSGTPYRRIENLEIVPRLVPPLPRGRPDRAAATPEGPRRTLARRAPHRGADRLVVASSRRPISHVPDEHRDAEHREQERDRGPSHRPRAGRSPGTVSVGAEVDRRTATAPATAGCRGLDDDRARHLRVDSAVVGVRAGRIECDLRRGPGGDRAGVQVPSSAVAV